MQSFIWAPEHSDALRDCLSRGMSYAQAAKALNARFGTQFTRNAAVGRAKRLGLLVAAVRKVALRRRPPPSRASPAPATPNGKPDTSGPAVSPPASALARNRSIKLRCVGIKPRLLAFVDLEPGDCRYPYGGEKEGEAYAFCGHPRLPHASYCRPHYQLTHNNPGTASDRVTVPITLRLVKAA